MLGRIPQGRASSGPVSLVWTERSHEWRDVSGCPSYSRTVSIGRVLGPAGTSPDLREIRVVRRGRFPFRPIPL